MRPWLLLLVPTLACYREVERAPTELDELSHYLFVEYDSDDVDTLLEGVDNLHALHSSDGSSEGWTGALSPLDGEAFEAVGREPDLDTEWLKGVFELVPQTRCTPMDLAAIYAFDDQLALFPGQYDAYSRTYAGDTDCFLQESCQEVAWTAHISDTIGVKKGVYDYEIEMRRLEGADGQPVVLARAWMPEAAEVGGETDGGTFFDQSYTIEAFSLLPSGDVLHYYALWNSGGLKGIDPDADVWEAQYVKGVQDWNDRLDELCDEERGLWD